MICWILILVLEYSQVLFMIHNLCPLHLGQIHEGLVTKTLKRLSHISPQLSSGELDGIHISGYDESQSSLSFSELICILGKKTNGRLASNIIVDNEIIIFVFILAIVKMSYNKRLFMEPC